MNFIGGLIGLLVVVCMVGGLIGLVLNFAISVLEGGSGHYTDYGDGHGDWDDGDA